MSQNYYKLYIDSVIELASTIVIKSERSADVINNRITELYGTEPDPFDKTTWKYYLNISGQYHPTDPIIEITSLDDLSKITFDRQTLINHPATLDAYKYNSRYYRELITNYPDMQQFIIGCLHPADINKAIDSEDGTVLAYPEYLVEENEENLIFNIEHWIKNYKFRWDNKQFNEAHDLYAAANLGIMYLHLIPLILNLRLQACKTREAHSFHVRQYLASHGYLDQYLDHLNLKQRLFLYRNICFIERNAGKNKILNWLIDRLLTERNIPISEYTMRHDTSYLESTYYSNTSFRRRSITDVFSQTTKARPTINLDELLNKEKLLTVGNPEYIADTQTQIDKKFKNSLSSVVLTKDLESSIVDYSDSETYTLTEIKLGHWLRNSSENLYTAVISFKDPVTSVDRSLNAFDSYVFWFYCYCKSMGINLDKIPKLRVFRSTRIETQTVDDLRQLVNNETVPDDLIQLLIDTKVAQLPDISVEAFGDLVKDVYFAHKAQTIYLANEQNHGKRGQMQAIVDNLYETKEIDTLEIINDREGVYYNSYDQWLAAKGIVMTNYDTAMYEALHLEIFKNATGGDFYTKTQLSELQKAMTAILTQLSSYSIQILTEINSRTIRKIGWPAIRVDDLKTKQIAHHEAEIINTYVTNVVSQENEDIIVPVMPIGIDPKTDVSVTADQEIDIPVKVRPGKVETIKNYIIRLGTIMVNQTFVNPDESTNILAFPQYESFNDLTEQEQWSIKDVWQNLFVPDPSEGKIDLNLLLMKNYLPGFKTFIINKPKTDSFIYKFIPNQTYARIRTLLTGQLEAMLPNLGENVLNAYNYFAGDSDGNLFKLFAGTAPANAFKYFANKVTASTTYMDTNLQFGVSLDAFIYTKDEVSINAFIYDNEEISLTDMEYVHDKASLNFVKDVISRTPHHHPYLPGSLFNGFSLVNSEGEAEYKIVGYSYNGQQIIWS